MKLFRFFREIIALKIVYTILLIVALVSCNTVKPVSGYYETQKTKGSIEHGRLTITGNETQFNYEWREHLACGITRGSILKQGNRLVLTSYYDALPVKEPIVLRKKLAGSTSIKINFYTIDSLNPGEVLFKLNKGPKSFIEKSDSLGHFSIDSFIGNLTIEENLEYTKLAITLNYNHENVVDVFLLPNIHTISYRRFDHEVYKIRRNKLIQVKGDLKFRKMN